MNPRIVIAILQLCSASFVSITPLVGKVTSGSNLYRHKDELLRLGWLETDGRKKFHTTPQGMLQLRTLLGEAPAGLCDIYPLLAQVPSPYHRAMIELILCAIVARDLREDRHLAFVMVGPTLTWKTSMARFLLHLLGLDPVKNIVDMGVESGLSLWRRKTPMGGVSYRRELLDSRFVTFDEAQKASKECIRQLDKWTSGTRRVAFENSEEVIQPVSLILMNPREGKTLKDRLGMDEPTLRRRIICEVTRASMPDLAATGEEIVEAARKHGPIQLPKPRHDLATYKQSIYELFKKTFNQEGQQLVDVESLALLCWGMTAFKEPVEAIRLVFYDALLLYGTLGWTIPGWQQIVSQYPETPRLDDAKVTPANEVSQELLVKAFKHLDEAELHHFVTHESYLRSIHRVACHGRNLKQRKDVLRLQVWTPTLGVPVSSGLERARSWLMESEPPPRRSEGPPNTLCTWGAGDTAARPQAGDRSLQLGLSIHVPR